MSVSTRGRGRGRTCRRAGTDMRFGPGKDRCSKTMIEERIRRNRTNTRPVRSLDQACPGFESGPGGTSKQVNVFGNLPGTIPVELRPTRSRLENPLMDLERPMLMRTILILAIASTALADERPQSSPVGKPATQPVDRSGEPDPVPTTTPYDADMAKRNQYRLGYRDGHDWAIHPDRHDHATTNPGERNIPAIRGFIEGWKAGVRSLPEGQPAGDLPAKYARFLVWNQAEADAFVAERQVASRDGTDWERVRADRIKAHERGLATEFTGRWTMTLPRGFTYEVEMTVGENGLLDMKSKSPICLLGGYSTTGNRLQLVRPREGIHDLDWEYRDGVFVLTSESVRNGGHYVGAKLERVP